MQARHRNLFPSCEQAEIVRRAVDCIPMRTRHDLSTARAQSPVQTAIVLACEREPLNPTMVTSATKAPPNCPKPCIAKTAPIMAPLHFVVANSEVIMEERG